MQVRSSVWPICYILHKGEDRTLNQAGVGLGGETDADPVGVGADVDAGGVRMEHGQHIDLGGVLGFGKAESAC
jgi:hypothetical protein